ncbi:MAG: 5-formyltetrahydrofolate cyclo-ligase [archaeon]
MEKSKIRRDISKMRDKMPLQEVLSKSAIIKDLLFGCEKFIKAKSVLFYASFKNEVSTKNMIYNSLESKIVLLPKIQGNTLSIHRIDYLEELCPNKYGILEPREKDAYDSFVDLAIVPGVAFDNRGYRIGSGRGYYDRLLKEIKPDNIGFAFSFQVVDSVPYLEYDVPVDTLITEQGIINCIKERQKSL